MEPAGPLESVERVGAYPGSFNPLTVAHLAVAETARDRCRLDRVDLVVSRVALGKEGAEMPRLEHRIDVLTRAAASRPWLGVVIREAQLVADLAEGYDVVVLGADKWEQVLDPRFYGGSTRARDRALGRLPVVALAARPPHPGRPWAPGRAAASLHPDRPGTPDARCIHLAVPVALGVSSTGARSGMRSWMAPESLELDDRTGAWSDQERYRRWLDTLDGPVAEGGDGVPIAHVNHRR